MIAGGFAAGGGSSSARKKHIRRALQSREVLGIEAPNKKPRTESLDITFTEDEAMEMCQPHDDPLVVSAVISNFQTRRILIDSGSSADILFWGAFEQLQIQKEALKPITSPLVGFTGDRLTPLGSIELPVTMGEGP